jgi:hypothetical protein
MVWLYLGGLSKADRGLPPAWYSVFLVLRVAGVLYLVWRVWRRAAQRPATPEPGPADEDGEDRAVVDALAGDAVVDELAGDFTDAPDRLLVRLG